MAYWTSSSTRRKNKARREAGNLDPNEFEQQSGDEDDKSDEETPSPVKPKPKASRKEKKVIVQEPDEDEVEELDEERSELAKIVGSIGTDHYYRTGSSCAPGFK
jgi:hypothetical protein